MKDILQVFGIPLLVPVFLVGSYIAYNSFLHYQWIESASERMFVVEKVKIHGVFDAASRLYIYTFEGFILPEKQRFRLDGVWHIKKRNLDEDTFWKAEGDTIKVLTDLQDKAVDASHNVKSYEFKVLTISIFIVVLCLLLLYLLYRPRKKMTLILFGGLLSATGFSQQSIGIAGPTEQPVFGLDTFVVNHFLYDSASMIRPGFNSLLDVVRSTPEQLAMSYISEKDSSWTASNTYPGLEVTVQSPCYYTDDFKNRIFLRPISRFDLTPKNSLDPTLVFMKVQFWVDEKAGPIVVLVMKKKQDEWRLFDDGRYFEFQIG